MNEFKSAIATELSDYLSIRQMTLAQGSYKYDCQVLEDFDGYFAEHGESEKVITEGLVNGWTQYLRTKNHSRTVSNKVSCLRCFLRYLRYCGIPVFMPRCPKWNEDYVPYIFSDAEMKNIFQRSDNTADVGNNKIDFEVAMLIRVLYGCGLRHGEALQLIRSDVDFERGSLLLRQPKNKKQRIVPMHSSLSQMLMQYCAAMKIYDKPEAFLFPGAKSNSPLSMRSTGVRFRTILESSNIYIPPEKPGRRGQCVHCLRHVFAVNSFAQAEKKGRPAADSAPYLSVYLGHFDMDGTEKYLKFSGDIFPEYTEMFETYSTDVFSVLGGVE
jgi:site-specific recombinase XerD